MWQLSAQRTPATLASTCAAGSTHCDLTLLLRPAPLLHLLPARAGVFALDTADIYGPSEAIIGQHLRLNPGAAQRTKVQRGAAEGRHDSCCSTARTAWRT